MLFSPLTLGGEKMGVSVENISEVQKKLHVVIPSIQVDNFFEKVSTEVQKGARIKGFRVGKVPLNIVEKLYSHEILDKVTDLVFKETLYKALLEEQLNPVDSPLVDSKEPLSKGKDFSYHVVVDVLPQFELTKYKGLSVTAIKYFVSDARINKEIEYLRLKHANVKETESEQEVVEGHLVEIEWTIYPTSNKSVENPKRHRQQIIIDKGFSVFDAVGMKVGETKDLNQEESSADKANSPLITGKILKISFVDKPDLTEEWIKSVGFASAEEMKEKLRRSLTQKAESLSKSETNERIIATILSSYHFAVPPAFVDRIIDKKIQDVYKKHEDIKKILADETIRAQHREVAKEVARWSLVFDKILKQEKIEVNKQDYMELAMASVPHIGKTELEQTVDWMMKGKDARFEGVERDILLDRCLKIVLDSASNIQEEKSELP